MSRPSRRQVLVGGCAAGAACLVAGCGGRSGAADVTAAPDGTVRVPRADVEVGGSTHYPGARIIVGRPAEDDYRAFDATCPHQGCQVSGTGADGQLVCPCHDSTFDPATGDPLSGPATTGLTSLTVTTDGDDLVIRG